MASTSEVDFVAPSENHDFKISMLENGKDESRADNVYLGIGIIGAAAFAGLAQLLRRKNTKKTE